MNIRNAYYIKLGEGGKWEESSIQTNGVLRLGWKANPLVDVKNGNWDLIKEQLRSVTSHKGTVTRDVNALRKIVESVVDDIWITFYSSSLWWCRLVGDVHEDGISKFRKTVDGWRNTDANNRTLGTAEIPGSISQLQGFRGTVCTVKPKATLARVLKAEYSPEHKVITAKRDALAEAVSTAITNLHWKDFETLVDLLFRHAGWRRLGLLGETMKFADLELQEPITGEKYQVQVKSQANKQDFVSYRDQFTGRGFRKLFFVVHSPDPGLTQLEDTESVELILPERLGRMIVNAGLVDWVLTKIR